MCFAVLRMKIEQNLCVIVEFNAILGGIDDLCKLGKEYLIALTCK